MPREQVREITQDQWEAEGKRRFGANWMDWKFICPVCKHVASIEDWKDAGASEGEIAFSCVGRRMGEARDAMYGKEGEPGPCNYAGGGLFRLNPIHVTRKDDGTVRETFDFAPVEGVEPWADL